METTQKDLVVDTMASNAAPTSSRPSNVTFRLSAVSGIDDVGEASAVE